MSQKSTLFLFNSMVPYCTKLGTISNFVAQYHFSSSMSLLSVCCKRRKMELLNTHNNEGEIIVSGFMTHFHVLKLITHVNCIPSLFVHYSWWLWQSLMILSYHHVQEAHMKNRTAHLHVIWHIFYAVVYNIDHRLKKKKKPAEAYEKSLSEAYEKSLSVVCIFSEVFRQ